MFAAEIFELGSLFGTIPVVRVSHAASSLPADSQRENHLLQVAHARRRNADLHRQLAARRCDVCHMMCGTDSHSVNTRVVFR